MLCGDVKKNSPRRWCVRLSPTFELLAGYACALGFKCMKSIKLPCGCETRYGRDWINKSLIRLGLMIFLGRERDGRKGCELYKLSGPPPTPGSVFHNPAYKRNLLFIKFNVCIYWWPKNKAEEMNTNIEVKKPIIMTSLFLGNFLRDASDLAYSNGKSFR